MRSIFDRVPTTRTSLRSARNTGDPPTTRALVADLHYEVVPMASAERAVADLPSNASISVTCSPTKGIVATQELTVELIDRGHRPTPHLAARLVEDREHVTKLANWLREYAIEHVFVIAGDAPEPVGPYEAAMPFLRDLLDADPGPVRIGVPGYPDGHPFVPATVVVEQLQAKCRLLEDRGIAGWVSTQMCFDPRTVRAWIEAQRLAGMRLPIRLGIAGVVERRRLVSMGTRLGIGASMRYLRKNRASMTRLMSPGGYDPTALVEAFATDADALGIEGVHCFTFNSVADTRAWQQRLTR